MLINSYVLWTPPNPLEGPQICELRCKFALQLMCSFKCLRTFSVIGNNLKLLSLLFCSILQCMGIRLSFSCLVFLSSSSPFFFSLLLLAPLYFLLLLTFLSGFSLCMSWCQEEDLAKWTDITACDLGADMSRKVEAYVFARCCPCISCFVQSWQL